MAEERLCIDSKGHAVNGRQSALRQLSVGNQSIIISRKDDVEQEKHSMII